jgi:hypothetical protein
LYIDSSIPLKDDVIVETIRGAVLWVIWLERNKLCYTDGKCRNIKAIGLHIISLTFFWCTNMGKGNLLKLSLVLPQNTDDLFIQVPVSILEGVAGGYPPSRGSGYSVGSSVNVWKRT